MIAILPYAMAMATALFTYWSAPQNIREGFTQQMTVRNFSRTVAAGIAATAVCTIAHECGHALAAKAVGMPIHYLCFGREASSCNPQNAWLSLGNLHIAGLDFRHGCVNASIEAFSALDKIKMFVAGPIAGLLAHFAMQRFSKGRLSSTANAVQQASNLLPRVIGQQPTDGTLALCGANMAICTDPYWGNNIPVWAEMISTAALEASLWPRSKAYANAYAPATSRWGRLCRWAKGFFHRIAITEVNMALFSQLNIPMQFDAIDGSKPAEAPVATAPVHEINPDTVVAPAATGPIRRTTRSMTKKTSAPLNPGLN